MSLPCTPTHSPPHLSSFFSVQVLSSKELSPDSPHAFPATSVHTCTPQAARAHSAPLENTECFWAGVLDGQGGGPRSRASSRTSGSLLWASVPHPHAAKVRRQRPFGSNTEIPFGARSTSKFLMTEPCWLLFNPFMLSWVLSRSLRAYVTWDPHSLGLLLFLAQGFQPQNLGKSGHKKLGTFR